jgi:Uma2 family endonuclease
MNEPERAELIDGTISIPAPQKKWHSHLVTALCRELDRQTPNGFRAQIGMAVELGRWLMPVPDLLVVTAAAFYREKPSRYYFAEDVILAIEIVSPDSEERDRDTKPAKYAKARIPHYWRVERQDAAAVVYAYELDPASNSYGLVGIFHDRLRVSVPFPIDIDLTDPGRRL